MKTRDFKEPGLALLRGQRDQRGARDWVKTLRRGTNVSLALRQSH